MTDLEKKAHDEAKRVSKEEGVVQHVNKTIRGDYYVSDWFCDGSTIASYENGKKLER